MAESKTAKKRRGLIIFDRLVTTYGVPPAFLNHETPFQLLIATIMSAQCTDARVNMVTPALFAEFPDAQSMANTTPEAIFHHIRSVSFGNTKSKNIVATAKKIMTEFAGEFPTTLDQLITLPGVGRKTANVVLGQAFQEPGITVDTHVRRLSGRLGFSKALQPEKIEQDLMVVWPKETWTDYSTVLILHARSKCTARKPNCLQCPIANLCPSAGLYLLPLRRNG